MAKLLDLTEKKMSFIKKANNGNIKPHNHVESVKETKIIKVEDFKPAKRGRPRKGEEKNPADRVQITLSVAPEQAEFFNELVEKTGERLGDLVWKSLLFAKFKPLPDEFLFEYSTLVYNKKNGIRVQFQRVLDSHSSLKSLYETYKEMGYKIKLKGVVLLYLLNYMKNYLGEDISKYQAFAD